MQRPASFKVTLLRAWPVLVLSALVSLHSASLSLGAGKGGDYARCLVECASMFRECKDSCRSLCSQEPGPPWSQQRRACLQACSDDCKEIRAECRDECKVIKPPPTPTVP